MAGDPDSKEIQLSPSRKGEGLGERGIREGLTGLGDVAQEPGGKPLGQRTPKGLWQRGA